MTPLDLAEHNDKLRRRWRCILFGHKKSIASKFLRLDDAEKSHTCVISKCLRCDRLEIVAVAYTSDII